MLDEAGNHSIVVPFVETIYYSRQQNGYHGGATPQEMICPLVILMDKTSTYSGLYPCEYPKPDWWFAKPVAAPVVDEPLITVIKSRPKDLLDGLWEDDKAPTPTQAVVTKPTNSTVTSAEWVSILLSSVAYKDQKAFVRRHAPEDDVVRRCLESLEGSGGIMTPAAFSKLADIPAARLDGLIARLQRLLNVDGYEILTFSRSENRIELNVSKLMRQFDLD